MMDLRPYKKFHTHPLIADTARGLAEAIWEEKCQRDNTFYKFFGSPQAKVLFIGAWAPKLVARARDIMTDMLAGPYPDALKEEIADALMKDHNLRHGLREKKPMRGTYR